MYSLHKDDIDYSTLRAALEKTTIKRGSTHILNEYEDIVDNIKNDKRLHDIWIKYSKIMIMQKIFRLKWHEKQFHRFYQVFILVFLYDKLKSNKLVSTNLSWLG